MNEIRNMTRAVSYILERNGVEHIGSFLMKSQPLVNSRFEIKESGEKISFDHECGDMDNFVSMFAKEALNYKGFEDRARYGEAKDIFSKTAHELGSITKIKTVKDVLELFPDRKNCISTSGADCTLNPEDIERVLKGDFEPSETVSGIKIEDLLACEVFILVFAEDEICSLADLHTKGEE